MARIAKGLLMAASVLSVVFLVFLAVTLVRNIEPSSEQVAPLFLLLMWAVGLGILGYWHRPSRTVVEGRETAVSPWNRAGEWQRAWITLGTAIWFLILLGMTLAQLRAMFS